MPFIDELLSSINTIICDLQPQQVQTFYEAVGHMISASTDQSQQEQLIEKYMQLPNQVTRHVNKTTTPYILFHVHRFGTISSTRPVKTWMY